MSASTDARVLGNYPDTRTANVLRKMDPCAVKKLTVPPAAHKHLPDRV
jgi:hypothetical protein